MGEKLIKQLQKLALTKRLKLLVGSGASMPAISLMGHFEESNGISVNQQLLGKVKEVSEILLSETYTVVNCGSVLKTLNNYQLFLESIVYILTFSNSRVTVK